MTQSPEVIRIEVAQGAPEEFKEALVAEIKAGIRLLMSQYTGRVTEADIEVAVGTLYKVKWALEARKETRDE